MNYKELAEEIIELQMNGARIQEILQVVDDMCDGYDDITEDAKAKISIAEARLHIKKAIYFLDKADQEENG